MLDDDDGVAEVAKLLERREQSRVVALMQPDRRLVEDVEHAHESRADLRRQPNALRFATRQRLRRAAEREIVEADVDEKAQTLAHFLQDRPRDLGVEPRTTVLAERNRLEERQRSVIGKLDELADVPAVHCDGQRFGLQPPAAAPSHGTSIMNSSSSMRTVSGVRLVVAALDVREHALPLDVPSPSCPCSPWRP